MKIIEILGSEENFKYFTELLKSNLKGAINFIIPSEKIKFDMDKLIEKRITFDCDNCGKPIHTSDKKFYECDECGNNIYIPEQDIEIFYILRSNIIPNFRNCFNTIYNFNELKIRIVFGEINKYELRHDKYIYVHITPFDLWTDDFLIMEKKYADHFAIGWNYILDLFDEQKRELLFKKIFNSIRQLRKINLYERNLYSTENTINILHLSDFHIEGGLQDNEKSQIIKNLIKDVKEELLLDKKIDFILITGDLSDAGKEHQFRDTEKILIKSIEDSAKGLDVDRENIYIVPGNHDIDRDFFYEYLFDRLTSSYDQNELRRFWYKLEPSYDYDFFFKKFKAFKKFQEVSLNQTPIDPDKLFITRSYEKLNYKIGILGLCTVWVGGTDGEDGNLLISRFQIIDALENYYDINKNDLNIVFFHHPIDSLLKEEREIIEPLIFSNFDFVLFGHYHDTRYKIITEYNKFSNLIRAGCVYSGHNKIFGSYNLIQLDTKNKQARIIFRKPIKTNPYVYFFDIEVSPKKENLEKFGIIEIPLPEREFSV